MILDRNLMLFVLALAHSCVFAMTEEYYVSQRVNGIQAVVCTDAMLVHPERKTTSGIRKEERLLLAFRAATNLTCGIAYPANCDVLCKVELTNEPGRIQRKRLTGLRPGKEFEQFKMPFQGKLIRAEVGSTNAPTFPLFKPEAAFTITRPGTYTLSLYVQAVKLSENNMPLAKPEIVKLGPIYIPIVEPEP